MHRGQQDVATRYKRTNRHGDEVFARVHTAPQNNRDLSVSLRGLHAVSCTHYRLYTPLSRKTSQTLLQRPFRSPQVRWSRRSIGRTPLLKKYLAEHC